jgi:hypothetical protein
VASLARLAAEVIYQTLYLRDDLKSPERARVFQGYSEHVAPSQPAIKRIAALLLDFGPTRLTARCSRYWTTVHLDCLRSGMHSWLRPLTH